MSGNQTSAPVQALHVILDHKSNSLPHQWLLAYCYDQLPGTLELKQWQSRLVLEWMTVLVCQFLVKVLQIRQAEVLGAAFAATV